MPLSAELEALVGLITDPTKREATRKQLLENSENGLRQSDYSRRMNELTAKQKEWQSWHQKADAEFKAAIKERDDLKNRVSLLEEAKKGDDLTGVEDEALNKALREARAELAEAKTRITQFDQMLEQGKLVTADKMEEELVKRGDGLGAAIFDVIDKQTECFETYGKRLDRNQLISEAQKRNGDLQGAYEYLTKDFKEAKIRQEIEAEYEKKYAERIKTSNLPLDQGGGEPNLGPLQVRLQKKETGNIPEDVMADGSGRLANLVAQELRQEGKF
jgi:hypothetical protein